MKLTLAGSATSPTEESAKNASLDDARRGTRTSRHLTLDEALAHARADGREPVVPGEVPGGKSVCLCQHRGDGSVSEHAGFIGHVYCKVPDCGCPKFSWRRFIWDKE